MDFRNAEWVFEPEEYEVGLDEIKIITEPETDFWQRSYYGFRNDNAPALQIETDENFSFTVKVKHNYKKQFDQSGVIIYLDSENWFKASVEYENENFSRLGSVVTNMGYSDWATTDIELPDSIWYRLSRRGPDFLIESSEDGVTFKQMRVFHIHKLGETTPEMGKTDPPMKPKSKVKFGIYACSPLETSFEALFTDIKLERCLWKSH